ncbi:serine-rich coiled-coil domain-containing protein 2 isoform X1 [Hemitrygon akajei]|uniref:serine-rich coiled-coil domain-containing protein 2 isoform X1 n=1 Tax=Hemitrygon akajei TaxID=2704970 RepID=UPI003BF97FEA
MEGKTPSKSASVSRLPKFGGGTSKLSEILPQPESNGACVRSVSASSSSNFDSKQNGTGRSGAFSFNWKKSGKTKGGGQGAKNPVSSLSCSVMNEAHAKVERNFYSKVPLVKDHTDLGFKSKSTAASSHQKKHQFVPCVKENKMLVTSSNHSSKGNHGKLQGKSFTTSHISRSQSFGHFRKTALKMSDQEECFSASSSSKGSLNQSTESLKNLLEENIVRSQSFSYSTQSNSCSSDVIPRSLSFSKAADVSRPCLKQQMRISLPLKSNAYRYGARGADSPSTAESLSKSASARLCLKVPSSALKKSQLPTCLTSSFYTGTSASKMSQSSLIKCNRLTTSGTASNVNSVSDIIKETDGIPTLVGSSSNNVNVNIEYIADNTLNSNAISEKADLGATEELQSSSAKDIDDPEGIISIYSNSDIINNSEQLANSGTESIEILDSDNSISTEIPDDLYIPNEAMSSEGLEEALISTHTGTEWMDTGFSDHCKDLESSQTTASGNDLVSSDANYAMGSSFELSPSSSSAGTYMWDEEGMEGLGTVQQCGSLESSEMNSLDILNNLESGDLDENDLMLDVDLPEDAPCKIEPCESMAHLERSERGNRNQGFWRKRYPRWRGQDHQGNSELQRSPVSQELPVGHFDWAAASSYYHPSANHVRSSHPMTDSTVMLDVLTLRHMVQDCTAVKTQILKLKRLLQQNGDGSSVNDLIAVVSPTQEQAEAINSTDKTNELLGEIQVLQEEMKRKDQIIEQLQQQLSTRCNCQKENSATKRPACSNVDKTTQTVTKGISPPVLQPSNYICSSKDRNMGKLAKPIRTEDPSRNLRNGSNENCRQTNQGGKNVICSQLDSDKGFTQSTQQKDDDCNDKSAQKLLVSNKAKQNPGSLPKERQHSQVSVQEVSLPSTSVFTEEALNKGHHLKFAFKQCLPSKDLNVKPKIQTSIMKSSLISKSRKNADAIHHTEIFSVNSPVQPPIDEQKESEQQSIPTNLSTQKDEQQKRKFKPSPSLSSPFLSIKTSAFSASPGSLHKEIQCTESAEYQDESSSETHLSSRLPKKQLLREDCPAKDQRYESQAEKPPSSVRHSRLPKPKTHAFSPSN